MKTFKEYGIGTSVTIGGKSQAFGTMYPMADLRTEPLNADAKKQQMDNVSAKLNKKDRLEYLKLLNKAMKTMPASPKQKDLIKQLNVYRTKASARPLTIPR